MVWNLVGKQILAGDVKNIYCQINKKPLIFIFLKITLFNFGNLNYFIENKLNGINWMGKYFEV
jgi:hypothetical protein